MIGLSKKLKSILIYYIQIIANLTDTAWNIKVKIYSINLFLDIDIYYDLKESIFKYSDSEVYMFHNAELFEQKINNIFN